MYGSAVRYGRLAERARQYARSKLLDVGARKYWSLQPSQLNEPRKAQMAPSRRADWHDPWPDVTLRERARSIRLDP